MIHNEHIDMIKKINNDIGIIYDAIKEKFNEVDIRIKKIEKTITNIEQCIIILNQKSKKQSLFLKTL